MDDEIEINLKDILRKLLQAWRWIAGFAVLCGLVVFVYTYTQPRYYQASAMVALRRPLYQPNFDTRYQTITPTTLNSKIVADFATSDEVVKVVYQAWDSTKKNEVTLDSFRKNYLETKSGDDTTVIHLIVRQDNGEDALRLANLWANTLVEKLNEIYAAQTQRQIEYFKARSEIARTQLEKDQQALVDFESKNEVSILTNRLNTLLDLQRESLRRQRLIQYVLRDTNTLMKEYDTASVDKILPSSERSKLLFLQLRVYADATSTSLTPIQLQLVPSDSLENPLTVGQFQEEIRSWINALRAQDREIQKQVDLLNEQILQLQYQIAQLNSQRETLQRNKDIAFDTFTVMVRKVQEVTLSTEDESTNVARVGSQAVVNSIPSRGTLRNTSLATGIGFFVAVFGVLVWDWWRSEEEETSSAKEKMVARDPVVSPKL